MMSIPTCEIFHKANFSPEYRVGWVSHLHYLEEKIKERMDYFKDQAKQLIEIRKSGHLPDDKS